VLALQHLLDNGSTIAVNLGTGHGASVRQVLDTARRITGLKIVARDASRRAVDPPVWWPMREKPVKSRAGGRSTRT